MVMINGVRVFACDSLSETKEVHRKPRKWVRRVGYQKWREFDCTYAQVPSRQAIKTDDGLFMHPALIDELQAALADHRAKGVV